MAKIDAKKLYASYVSKMRSFLRNDQTRFVYESLCRGKSSYIRFDRLESSAFDLEWISKIEDCIFDLGDILKAPRLNTKSTADLTPVELAKKTTGESVQHLASHTQYVKEVDDYGNVIPSKILSIGKEDDILTYENRFIATLVRKLCLFVEKRYEFALNFAKLHDEEVLYIKNHSKIGRSVVDIETKVKVVSESESESSSLNDSAFSRILDIRDYVLYYYNCPFMKSFKTERNVRNPILKTNIIRKNPKYHHCYELYKYIERYSTLGITYHLDEQYRNLSKEDLDYINFSLLGSYLSLQGDKREMDITTVTKEYKPHLLRSLDDESFIYGPYLKGPVQFVRVDEGYRQYLERMTKKDLPRRPKGKEKEYFKDEYQDIKDLKEFDKEKGALIRRKEKEARDFDKKAEKIVLARDKARLALEQEQTRLIKQEETDYLNKIREQIILAAKNEIKSFKFAELEESKPSVEPVIEDSAKQESVEPVTEPIEQAAEEEKVVPSEEPVAEEPAAEETAEPATNEGEEVPAEQPVEEAVEAPSEEEEAGESNQEENPVDVAKSPQNEDESIYVVKSEEGYFLDDGRFVSNIDEAKLFDSEEAAKEVANRVNGEVIKL